MPDISRYAPQTGLAWYDIDGVRHEGAVMSNDGDVMEVYEVLASGFNTKFWDTSDDEDAENRCQLAWCSAADMLPFTSICEKSREIGGDGTCYANAGPNDLIRLDASDDFWRRYDTVQDGARIPDADYKPLLDHFSRHVPQRERTLSEIFLSAQDGAAGFSGGLGSDDGRDGVLMDAFASAIAEADPEDVRRGLDGRRDGAGHAAQDPPRHAGAMAAMMAMLERDRNGALARQDDGPDFGP